MKKRVVDAQTYMSVLRELLSQGKEVPLMITGSSMSPFLVHERDEILISPPDGIWKKGDLAFFQRKNGHYVMHRIVKVASNGDCFFIGDGQMVTEGPICPEQIFGKITAVKRKGKWIGPGNFWWEFFEHVWLNTISLRPLFRKLYSLVTFGKQK